VEKDPPRTVNAMNDLGMLIPGFNRGILEKGIDMSIQTMHGKKVDTMEVRALMELANKTMSKFPFKLPKHLALYMRMASILEGIYLTHKVNFKFINVLRNILEEENLIRDAYVEELKYSLNRFAKSIDATISIAPELKQYLDENRSFQNLNSKSAGNILLSGSILSAAVFVGSAVLYTTNEIVGQLGMIGSAIIMAITVFMRER
jgi:predicted unusual protein kinase regulating ubiquinone biosynthesis (AarF/ABC1/UbiB family)